MREGLEQLPVVGKATVEVAQGQWWLDTAPNPSTARMGLAMVVRDSCVAQASSDLAQGQWREQRASERVREKCVGSHGVKSEGWREKNRIEQVKCKLTRSLSTCCSCVHVF